MKDSSKNKKGKNNKEKLEIGKLKHLPNFEFPISTFKFQFSIFILALFLTASCSKESKQSSHEGHQYTCPMHPQIVQDMPGTCPICGMDLVQKERAGGEVKITKELSNLLRPTSSAIVSSIRTIVPVKREVTFTTETKGIIAYDTRRATTLPIRYGGRIEKLYVKYNFQPIHKGQKVLEIYSPELVTAQRELLYLLESDPENTQLINGAKQRLYLLGVSENQVTKVITSRTESYSFPVFSPVDGYIIEETAANGSGPTSIQTSQRTDMGNGMSAPGSAASNSDQILSKEIRIREGTYVSSGETLFSVVNTLNIWAEFNLYQNDVANIKVNDPLQISFDNTNSEAVNAKVNFIQPFFKVGENFVKVRAYLTNPKEKYEIGQLVTAKFNTTSKGSLWIPTTAVLDLGSQKIIFVKRRGVFRPKSVETGNQSNDLTEIIGGADESDSIAYQAQFMVDSESFIKVVR